jgi:protein TonB
MLSGDLSVSCPERSPPDYPMVAKRMNEQGKVVLRVELGEDGRVINATVKISSGYQRLDAAALNAVKTWRCKPSVRNDVAMRTVALQPFSFILEGR